MPRLFLTPFVIAGLLFLSSCSNAEARACDEVKQAYSKNLELDSLNGAGLEFFYKANLIIVNNQNCFTPDEVATAQLSLR